MNTIRFACRPGYPMGVLAVALLGCCVVGAQSSEKAKPALAKAAKPPSSAAGHGASAAGHGPAAAGGTHGPSPTTAGGSHGPTTSAHGPSTAGGSAGRPGAGNKPNTVGGHDPTGRAAGGSATAASRAGKAGPQPKGSRTVSDAHGNEIRTRANTWPAGEWTSTTGWTVAGVCRWNELIIPGSLPTAEAAATYSIRTVMAAMNSHIARITATGEPMTGSTGAIRTMACTWKHMRPPTITHRRFMDGRTIPGPRR